MTKLVKLQQRCFRKAFDDGEMKSSLLAIVAHDDRCENGHNTFSITGELYRNGRLESAGCLHEWIGEHFPELAPLLKWHGCSTDGPLHYVANTCFHAGNRDHFGKAAGEPTRYEYAVRIGNSPVSHPVPERLWRFLQERIGTGDFRVLELTHDGFDPRYTFVGYGEKWHHCPFKSRVAADEFCEAMNRPDIPVEFARRPVAFSEGKLRDLDAARRCAIWPDATDEELTAPGLKERLLARLPALLDHFRAAVESLGLVY